MQTLIENLLQEHLVGVWLVVIATKWYNMQIWDESFLVGMNHCRLSRDLPVEKLSFWWFSSAIFHSFCPSVRFYVPLLGQLFIFFKKRKTSVKFRQKHPVLNFWPIFVRKINFLKICSWKILWNLFLNLKIELFSKFPFNFFNMKPRQISQNSISNLFLPKNSPPQIDFPNIFRGKTLFHLWISEFEVF